MTFSKNNFSWQCTASHMRKMNDIIELPKFFYLSMSIYLFGSFLQFEWFELWLLFIFRVLKLNFILRRMVWKSRRCNLWFFLVDIYVVYSERTFKFLIAYHTLPFSRLGLSFNICIYICSFVSLFKNVRFCTLAWLFYLVLDLLFK